MISQRKIPVTLCLPLMFILMIVCFPVYANTTTSSDIKINLPIKFGIKSLAVVAYTTPTTSGVGTGLTEHKDVPINKTWTITFSSPMDQSTIIPDNIKVLDNLNNVVGTTVTSASSNAVTIKPTADYKSGARYCIIIGRSIKSAVGYNLADNYFMYFDIVTTPVVTPNSDVDTDGDGLSDYQEIHKYFTDPTKADSDGDGIPDSDPKERTEYTYTINTTMRIKKPYNISVMNDDYQDATLVSETSDYGVFNITLYPDNTNTAKSTYDWRTAYQNNSAMQAYLQPTITANFDDELKTKLFADLKNAGIDVLNSTYNGTKVADNQIVERTANWLLSNTQFLNEFTTYYTCFPNGVATVYPGLESRFQIDKGDQSWTTQQEFDHELFGKQMYMNKSHGSCTSTAVLWETVFRAIGIPTRMIMTVPIIDGNDPNQNAMLSNITDANMSSIVKQGALEATGFAAHTYNEVYVGGRWTRLNYNHVAQNIIDPYYFGAMIHINTMNDLSEVDLIPWGQRYALHTPDSFKYGNPYESDSISSANGVHSKLTIVTKKEVTNATIQKIMTYSSTEVPASRRGHKDNTLLAKINTADNNLTETEICDFMSTADKIFIMKDASGAVVGSCTLNSNHITDNQDLYFETNPLSCDISTVVTIVPENTSQWNITNTQLFR